MMTLIKAVEPEVRRQMLLAKVKTYQEAVDIAKSEEFATIDTKACSGTSQEYSANAISAYRKDQRQQRQHFEPQQNRVFGPCIRCSKEGHPPHKCQAYIKQLECHKCHKKGHYADSCLMGRRRALSESGGQAHTVTASAFAVTASEEEKKNDDATFYGHDADWVKGLIKAAIDKDAEEFGYAL